MLDQYGNDCFHQKLRSLLLVIAKHKIIYIYMILFLFIYILFIQQTVFAVKTANFLRELHNTYLINNTE